jgi:hypothetical protein
MPLNIFITTTKTLADDTKAALAAEFTKIHSITGAPTSFVQASSQELQQKVSVLAAASGRAR